MDIQTRKLNLISYLVELKDEFFLEKIEKFIDTKKPVDSNFEKKRFSEKDLLDRAAKSNKDYENGRTISQEKLEAVSANW